MKTLTAILVLFSLTLSAQVEVIKQEQSIKTRVEFSNLGIYRESDKVFMHVVFNEIDSTGTKVGIKEYTLFDDEYNRFWNAWSTGKDLYEQLKLRDLKGNLIDIPDSVENEFLNKE